MGKIYKDGNLYGVSDFDDITNRPQESEPIDISELDLPMPAKPTEYPVLFDESSGEYQVGLYKRADGKVKPVWRKDVVLQNGVPMQPNTWTSLGISIPYIDKMVKPLQLADTSSSSGKNISFIAYGDYFNGSLQGLQTRSTAQAAYNVSCYYTKTSDEWKEV